MRGARGGLLLALAGIFCSGCVAPDPTFVAAVRASHDAIAPEYLRYVEADQALDEAARQRRRATVARWDEAIRSREPEARR